MFLFVACILAVAFLVYLIIIKLPFYFIILSIIGFFISYGILIVLIAFLLIMTIGVKKEIITPKKIFKFYTYQVCKAVITFYRLKIIKVNLEQIKDLKKFVFVSNHQSNFDPLLALSLMKYNGITFIMKKEIMKLPIIGRYLYSCGFYPLNRNDSRQGLKTIQTCIKVLNTNRPIGVYIEGTRSLGPELGEFKSGAFRMAYKTESDIVVTVIDNTYNIRKRFPFRKTTVLFKICKVLKYDEYKDYTTKELEVVIKEIMESNLSLEREKNKNLSR